MFEYVCRGFESLKSLFRETQAQIDWSSLELNYELVDGVTSLQDESGAFE